MKLKPIKQYHGPKLPTRRIIDEHPELLRLVPRRWQANPIVLTALAGLCVVMSGCKKYPSSTYGASRVAPVFQHGAGRGGFGCIAINPPVVLSEDEARQIIIDEAKRNKVKFTTPGTVSSRILIPTYQRKDGKISVKKLPLSLDGQDGKHRIYFEYVSMVDTAVWEKPPTCSVYSSNVLATAKRVRRVIQERKPEGAYAVFYDPYVQIDDVKNDKGQPDWTATMEKRNTQGKQMAREELRKQVQDFIQWLKSQGVI